MIRIGDVVLGDGAFLGPMAGVTDLTFRILCAEQGAACTSMEMISAKAVCFNNPRTWDLMKTDPAEGPVSLQLFGHDPEAFAEACARIRERGIPFTFLDINMGCPVPKIVGNGDGSALMRSPELIEKIVRAARENTDRPVTVKLRRGIDGSENAVECALAAQEGGAAAVAVHARTREQLYSGKADWQIIARTVEALSIPVIGNGDVTDGESAARMLKECGCGAVMTARAAQGNPWVFREIRNYLTEGRKTERPRQPEIIRMMLRHASMLCAEKGELTAMRQMRSHAAWYLAGFPGAASLRARITQVRTYREMEDLVKKEFPYACRNLPEQDGGKGTGN